MKGKQAVFSNIWFRSVLSCPVPLKAAGLCAWETALIAGVGLFSSVRALVYFQIRRLSARIVALITLERLLAWMDQYVPLKTRSPFARVVTLCATERFFSRVCQHVVPEGTSLFAREVALIAIESLFTRVSQQVWLEITSSCAREAALIALERLLTRMFPHVHPQLTSRRAWIRALVANVGLNCIQQRFFRNFCHFDFQFKCTSMMVWSARLEDNWGWRITETTGILIPKEIAVFVPHFCQVAR